MALPDWLDPVYEAEEMRDTDAYAIEERGVPSLDLMERAAGGPRARRGRGGDGAGPIRIVVGKGNNGGDGLAAARILREDGHEVDVLATGDLSELQGDAKENLDRLPGPRPGAVRRRTRLERLRRDRRRDARHGLRGRRRASRSRAPSPRSTTPGAPVIACDVPSGVNASTGEVEGEAVRAPGDRHLPRVEGRASRGAGQVRMRASVQSVDIGIPEGAPAPGGPA